MCIRDSVRVVLAGVLARTPVRVSVHPALARGVAGVEAVEEARFALDTGGIRVEPDVDFAATLAAGDLGPSPRVRVVGDPGRLWAAAAEAEATLLTGPVLAAGRREMLTVLREQTVSRTVHRFGHVPPGGRLPPA